jgi:hypothetical protein
LGKQAIDDRAFAPLSWLVKPGQAKPREAAEIAQFAVSRRSADAILTVFDDVDFRLVPQATGWTDFVHGIPDFALVRSLALAPASGRRRSCSSSLATSAIGSRSGRLNLGGRVAATLAW